MSLEIRDDDSGLKDSGLSEPLITPPDPTPVYTILLIVCFGAVMLAQMYVGLDRSIEIVGFDKIRFAAVGEYWRILTGSVSHASFLHVFMNSYAMYGFGKLVELLSNRANVAIVFLLSAIGGDVLSLVFAPDGLSIGASGGIIGLLGYLVVYAFKRRRFVSAEFRKSLLINIGVIAVFGLVLFPFIDNYGHLGGLVTGALYGLIQVPSDEYVNPQNAGVVTKALGIASLVICVAATTLTILILVSSR